MDKRERERDIYIYIYVWNPVSEAGQEKTIKLMVLDNSPPAAMGPYVELPEDMQPGCPPSLSSSCKTLVHVSQGNLCMCPALTTQTQRSAIHLRHRCSRSPTARPHACGEEILTLKSPTSPPRISKYPVSNLPGSGPKF